MDSVKFEVLSLVDRVGTGNYSVNFAIFEVRILIVSYNFL